MAQTHTQTFTRQAVADADKKRTLFIIDNVVYDATPFLDEHPGGHEVLVNVAGRDASEDFDDIGHSLDAKELMKKYAVGEVVAGERREVRRRGGTWAGGAAPAQAGSDASLLASWRLPVLLALLATAIYVYLLA